MSKGTILTEEKTIKTPELSIYGNIMSWENSVLQLSNVASVSTVSLQLRPFPLWTLVPILIGVVSLIEAFAVALIALIIGCGGVYYWYTKNEEIKNQKNLILQMNSGITFTFYFKDKKFLEEVYKVISSIIAEGNRSNQDVKINISNSTITGNAKVLNDVIL